MEHPGDADARVLDRPEETACEPATRWYCDPTNVLFGERLFGTGALYRLTVEQAAAIWDWAVWQVGRPFLTRSGVAQSGVAASLEQAVREAERAVEVLEISCRSNVIYETG